MELTNSIKLILKQINSNLIITESGIKLITLIVEYLVNKIIRIADILLSEHNIILISDYTIETAYSMITNGNIKQIGIKIAKKTINQFNDFNSLNKNIISEKNSRPRPKDKAGLTLTVKPIEKYMSELSSHKIKLEGAIYCTALLEYIISELLDISKEYTLKNNRKKITSDDIEKGIINDLEINKLINNSSAIFRLIIENDNM
jgi:histone H3/H4